MQVGSHDIDNYMERKRKQKNIFPNEKLLIFSMIKHHKPLYYNLEYHQ